MISEKTELKTVIGLSLFALILRLAFIAVFYHNPGNCLFVDSYTIMASSFLARGEFLLITGHIALETTPLFPLWIALLYWIFGQSPLVVLLTNALLSVATGLAFYFFARKFFSRRAGLIFLALWTLYPYSVYYCGWTYRETFIGFLTALSLGLLWRWFESERWVWAAASGACGALLGLTNPASLLFAGLAPLGILTRRFDKKNLGSMLLYGFCLAAVYSPWVIRNERVFGHPILTNMHGGKNLYYGLMMAPDDLGTEVETHWRRTDPIEVQATTLDDQGHAFEAYSLYKTTSRKIIRENPGRYLLQCAQRVLKFWRLVPYNRDYPYGYAKIFWVSLLSDGWLIPLGWLGLLFWRKRWKELLPFYLIAVLWPLSYYLTYAQLRFRMPVMPAIILLAASLLDSALEKASGNAAQS